MNRNKKILVVVASILFFYSLIGFVVIPVILKSVLPDKLTEALNRQVTINSIRLNPFSLSVTIEGLKIQDKNKSDAFVSFDELYTNIQTASLFKMGLVIKEFRLIKPEIRLVRLSDTVFNFSDLIPGKSLEENTETQKTEKKPFHFSISNIAIINGNISLEDKLIQKQHVFSDITLRLPLISNFDAYVETFSAPELTGNFNQAGLSIEMETKPFHNTLETITHLSVKDFNIPYYFSYIPENLVGFDISSGKLDINARASHINRNNQTEIEVQGKIILSELELVDKNRNRILTLPHLEIDVAPSHPLENQVKLSMIKVMSPELTVIRNPDSTINLTTLGPQRTEKEDVKAEAENASSDKDSAEKPFRFDLADLVLESGRVVFQDNAVHPETDLSDDGQENTSSVELSVDDIQVKISDFSTVPAHTTGYDISARINKKADISIKGGFSIDPLKLETDFSIGNVELNWAQPYIPDTVQLGIAEGRFISEGHVDALMDDKGEMNATITGRAAVDEFKAVDPSQNEAFITWQHFAFEGIDISVNPLKVKTDKVLLKDFTNQVVVLKDGTTNIDAIFKTAESKPDSTEKPSGKSQSEASASIVPVQINEVLLDNFDFRFKDTHIAPHFSTRFNLSDLRITGLTSEDFKAADILGKGKIDAYAPVNIKGQINPLKEDLFLDITYSLKNMELSPLSPYTGKFIGRMIEKGKLSTDIQYKIDQKTIKARNQILLDQFTLGKKVDSKDAANLPIGIAIALLKDRNGKINVDLPISGRTDDPEFKIGRTLVNAVTNLIVKAAASPFSIVGSVVGGGEELRFIEFDPAVTLINDSAVEKLDAVKKLMYERPGLTLEIAGYVDMKQDRAFMKNRELARKVKMLKNKKEARDLAAIDRIVLDPEEYEKLLRKVYRNDVLSDPNNKKTLKSANDATIQEMEALIKQVIDISEAELHLLALERAREVKNYLLQDETVSADRLFLKEPESLSPEKKDEFKAARVELDVR